ncbi:hypothetical protein BGW80DRAFT_1278006 [Lactifluus volemus]|nr:hypothetical protein BGW80DRAFT_1278006 [Lactifluus volemus]
MRQRCTGKGVRVHHIGNTPDGGGCGCNGRQLPPKREQRDRRGSGHPVTRKEEQRRKLPRKCRVHREVEVN